MLWSISESPEGYGVLPETDLMLAMIDERLRTKKTPTFRVMLL